MIFFAAPIIPRKASLARIGAALRRPTAPHFDTQFFPGSSPHFSHCEKQRKMEEPVNPEVAAARERLLARFGQAQQLGGKGTARRKTKKTHKSSIGDDKKLQLTLKRLGMNNVYGMEDVFFLREDGSGLHFALPKVQAAPPSNTYVVSGQGQERKDLAAFMVSKGAGQGLDPSLLSPEMIRKFQDLALFKKGAADAEKQGGEQGEKGNDEEVPTLVEDFEAASKE